jgi:hypothetical protein
MCGIWDAFRESLVGFDEEGGFEDRVGRRAEAYGCSTFLKESCFVVSLFVGFNIQTRRDALSGKEPAYRFVSRI